jgi:hypothetical protein
MKAKSFVLALLMCAVVAGAFASPAAAADPVTPISAQVAIHPEALNLGSHGKWVSCYIQIPQQDPSTIAPATVAIVKIGTQQLATPIQAGSGTKVIPDYNNTGAPALKVRFSRPLLEEAIATPAEVELSIAGQLQDATPFEGTATIRAIRFATAQPTASPGQTATLSLDLPVSTDCYVKVKGLVKGQTTDGKGWKVPIQQVGAASAGTNHLTWDISIPANAKSGTTAKAVVHVVILDGPGGARLGKVHETYKLSVQ